MQALVTSTTRKGTTLRLSSSVGLCLRASAVEAMDQNGRFASILNPWQPSSYRHAKPEEGDKGG